MTVIVKCTGVDDPKKRQILEAATDTFVRYGFRRTTMGDIAASAGMSRPALYLVFPNKEAIFVGVVNMVLDDALSAIRAALPGKRGLRSKLLAVFEIWLVRPYLLVANTPDAAELLEHTHSFARDAYERGQRELIELLTDVIAGEGASPPGLSAGRMAAVLVAAAGGLKASAKNVDELRKLINDLVELAVEAAHPSSPRTRYRRHPSC